MTIRTNARIAGIAFLVYIAAGVASMMRVPGALVHVVFSLLMIFSAFALGVTLYAITRGEDRDLAMLGLACRVSEGVIGAMFMPLGLALQAAGAAGAGTSDDAAIQALASVLARTRALNVLLSGTFFAVGSTAFAYLMLRGRMIPVVLAWIGVLASLLLVVALPLQLAGALAGPATIVIWLPMLAFEVPLAFWLLIKGVAPPARSGVSAAA